MAELFWYFAPIHNDFVTDIPITDIPKNKSITEVLHYYQDLTQRGFTIEFSINKDGTINKTKV